MKIKPGGEHFSYLGWFFDTQHPSLEGGNMLLNTPVEGYVPPTGGEEIHTPEG